MVIGNHHLESVSTSLEKTARQFFYPAGPISGKYYMTHQHQYCAYTQDSESLRLAYKLIKQYDFKFEAHISRTRFWVPADHTINSFVALRFKCVDHEKDHSLGV